MASAIFSPIVLKAKNFTETAKVSESIVTFADYHFSES